jgi:hypothetical protein
MTGLQVVFGSFCLQGNLQLGAEVTNYQSMQGGQSCCFHQAAAALPYSCNCLIMSSPSKVEQFSFEQFVP